MIRQASLCEPSPPWFPGGDGTPNQRGNDGIPTQTKAIMRASGSCPRSAEVAAKALLDLGCTQLEQRIGAHIASFGGRNCFQTDSALLEVFEREYARTYHVESIGRARRTLARREIIRSKRIYTGQKPRGAKKPSPHGTTSKWVRWDHLGVPDPNARREASIERNVKANAERKRDRAQHSAPVAVLAYSSRPPDDVDAELQSLFQEYERANYSRPPAPSEPRSPRPERPPD